MKKIFNILNQISKESSHATILLRKLLAKLLVLRKRSQYGESRPFASFSLLLLVVTLGAFYFWADTSIIDEVTSGQGKVVPSSHEQVIQNLEGGILSEMLVREGDIVQKDQILLRIDNTKSGASLREGQGKADALRAEIARLQAEASEGEPEFPAALDESYRAREQKLFLTRKKSLEEGVSSLQHTMHLAESELGMTEPLVARGAVSEVEVLRLKREISDMKGRIQERINTFRTEAQAMMSEKEAELASIHEVVTERKDSYVRSEIRSPMSGTVKNIKVTTLGGVIGPGQDIMEIVPLEDKLLVEAKIKPADVAFLRPEQQAIVKISAYDFSIYGGLKGHLERISADTILDETDRKESYYRVYVLTDSAHLDGKDGPLPILPGMVATVDVLTGRKSVLDYLLKPILKVKNSALRER